MTRTKAAQSRVLVVGAGSIGKRHIRNLLGLGAEVAVFRYRPTADACADPLPPEVTLIEKLDHALVAPWDAVVIANSTDQHVPIALSAARNGNHLFIEKPLSNSLRGVNELLRLSAERHLVVEAGFMLRFHPNLRWIRDYLQSGELGTLYYARALIGQYLPDWRPGTDYRQSYSAHRGQGGGVILDLIHELDLISWLLGDVVDVAATTNCIPHLQIETEALAQISLRLRSGLLAQVHLDYLRPSFARTLEIAGRMGVISWDYTAGTITLTGRNGVSRVVHRTPQGYERNDLFLAHMRHFLGRLGDQSVEPGSPLTDAISTLSVALACHKSAGERRFVRPSEIDEDFNIMEAKP